jgi:hypothetical protein
MAVERKVVNYAAEQANECSDLIYDFLGIFLVWFLIIDTDCIEKNHAVQNTFIFCHFNIYGLLLFIINLTILFQSTFI